MHLSQSVEVGVVYRRQPYLVKEQVHIMAGTAQISKVHHYFTWRSVNKEHYKRFESLFKCNRKNHQPLGWNWLSWGPEFPLLQRISSLELPASEMAAQINASQSSSNRHISKSTVQRRQSELLLYIYFTNKRKRRVWAKKHKQWTLDGWKSVLWSDESKF
jgi:hypothetical protein